MKKYFSSSIFVFCLALAGFLAIAGPVRALEPLMNASILADTDCVADKDHPCNYTLNTFVKLGTSVSTIILGIVGALSLAVFVYGGFRMLTSAGNAESVAAGKKSIIGAVVGLMIVFGSYAIIKFVINTALVPSSQEFMFNGQSPADAPLTSKAKDCSDPAPAGKGGTCKDTGQCGDGSVVAGTSECGKQVCCVPPPPPKTNFICEDKENGGVCFYSSCGDGRHIDQRYKCAKGPTGQPKYCCMKNTTK